MRYTRQFENLGTGHKGQVFLSVLEQKLYLEGFTLAIPEPDLGDDLWVSDLEQQEPRFYRCQIKSAFSSTVESGAQKYTVNFTKSAKARLSQRFYFIVGLYDPSLADGFHVACIPSKFFWDLQTQGKLRLTDEARTMLDFFVRQSDENWTYSLRLKYPPKLGKTRGKGEPADVSAYFTRGTLREALVWADHDEISPTIGQ